MIIRYFVILSSLLFALAFFAPTHILANSYFFQDEFNLERTPNTLDATKWNVYPNSTTEIRIKEGGGFVQFPGNPTNLFPYVVSKISPFPTNGDFILEFGIQYTSVVQRGNGLVVSLTPPANNINEVDKDKPEVYFFGVWQGSDNGFDITYNGYCAPKLPCSQPGTNIYNTPSPNLSYHVIKLIYSNSVYTVYIDGNKMFTSPLTTNRPQAVWFGNPANQYSIANWSSFKIDYIRVSGSPQPFLDLPWDYAGKGLSFNEAALSINSFFDHQYPLLSRGLDLAEPATNSGTIVNFLGETWNSDRKPYSKHDGYDYGKTAKAILKNPVLAAASGSATYHYDEDTIGNAIFIDHGNGYQTRYLHMLANSTIIKDASEVWVEKGQEIGKIGATGYVIPKGEAGAHIHFMVVQDKNGDGNFNDNIPDGVTDPFGWQVDTLDPWPSYTFNYLGQNRTGNKSYYLWRNNLANMISTVTPTSATSMNVGNYTLLFPLGSTIQNMIINAKSAPVVKPSETKASVGSTLYIKATDIWGDPLANFPNQYSLNLDFSTLDISKLKTDSLSFYSSPDGTIWTKEDTTFATPTSAQTQLNHFSYFAFLGERRDTTAPLTTPILASTEGQTSWFRSDVQLTLDASDNDLGVYYIIYRINDEEWQIYDSTPVNFTSEGHYKVDFYSVDEDENTEELKTIEFDIDKTAPVVTIDVNPKTIWPPNNKMVPVTVVGTSSDTNLSQTIISVDDEYNQIEPTFMITGSDLSQTIQLEARRKGDDLDGRTYLIKVTTEDLAGNTTTDQAQILVPHDQSKN